ncbi:MAG TPA: SusE domain-containing protein [Bacteroidales bacterium]|nr:SusE domain-containing protein [Bacteroidales bacterium]HRW27423.1 SusE domain-containing protein [Bacteroidales bacterium]
MKKHLLIYLIFIGLAGLFTACEEDGDKVIMLTNPVAPTLTTIPDLTLERSNGTQMLEFVGTPVDPGFQASATYYLEACEQGTNFTDPVTIWSGTQCKSMKITVSDLNGILVKKFPADASTPLDFRLRAVLVVDAGTGAPGTGTNPFSYSSALKGATVALYGLPRLDLVNSGMTQKIESALGDGKYTGLVKLDPANAFTLTDPDAGTNYGGAGGVLTVNGAAIVPSAAGWHRLNVDVNALTFDISAYMIGLVGSALTGDDTGWNSPDRKMDYDPATGTWSITIDLFNGDIKFRLNDGWAWNLGGTPDNLTVDGANIPLTAGNYTIVLTITNPNSVKGEVGGTCTIVKN